MADAHVVVVGLGPGGPDLVTAGTLAAIEASSHRHLRTTRHPAASVVTDASSFDAVYDEADDLAEVYPRIVELLIAAAEQHGEVLYAVPGSPLVAERTVELLLADAASVSPRCRVTVVPALSFLDLTWVRLGIDPVSVGVRVIDGQRFATEAAGERGPLLVSQCDSDEVLSDIKLLLDEGRVPSLRADATVTVLQRLGLADESVFEVPWLDLDRAVEPDHLTTLYLPELDAPVAQEVEQFVELVATLRRECPWDQDQTHESLRRHLLEETYEVLDAIDGLDVDSGEGYTELEEELGDLLFQIVFHTTLAIEAGQFTLADVAETVHDKLRDRHPHVFGAPPERRGAGGRVPPERRGAGGRVPPERRREPEGGGGGGGATIDELAVSWEQRKKVEKARDSVFDGVPPALPALAYAAKVRKKAVTLAEAGVEVPDLPGVSQLGTPVEEVVTEHAVAEQLYLLVEQARLAGIDPESALRTAARDYEQRARAAERAADSA